jgi:hypothetical protein
MRGIALVFLFSLCNVVWAQEDTLRLNWTSDYNLSWSDFKAEEEPELSLSALSKIAIPYTYSSDGEVDATVTLSTVFMKYESWYKRGKENHILLDHEQLHFDIAEIHRRLIVKAIKNSKFTSDGYDSELKKIVTDIWDTSYGEMQDKYDSETNYARYFKAQIVSEKLLELKEFKANSVTFTFQ